MSEALKSGDKELAFKESKKHWQLLMDMVDTKLDHDRDHDQVGKE